jgi:hypothetical protein
MDTLDYAFEVLSQIMVGEAQNADTSRCQKPGSDCIVGARARSCVLIAIQFDGELHGRTVEIEDVRSYRMLSAERAPPNL